MEWVEQAVFYQIFPDRFAKSATVRKPSNLEAWDSAPTFHGFKGGDLIGVADRLDYLKDLGINALYLCPIFSSTANHRYHTHDYYQVDPLLGGDPAFDVLIKAAQQRGIRIVLDAVFNHASRSFLPFAHALEGGESTPYRDWFHFDPQALQDGIGSKCFAPFRRVTKDPAAEGGQEQYGYRCWWDLPALPKLNFNNPQVQDYFLEVGRYWLEKGIDGWRLDVPLEIEDMTFWDRFRDVVKKSNSEAYIVAEIWHEAARYLAPDGPFDAVMNYYLGKPILNYFLGQHLDRAVIEANNYSDLRPLGNREFQATLAEVLGTYDHETTCRQMNLLTSHDTPRLVSLAGGKDWPGQLALAFLYLLPGAPCVYYGEEIGMPGQHDPDCRRAFPEQLTSTEEQRLTFHQTLLDLRRRELRLQLGRFSWVDQGSGDALVFQRTCPGEPAVICGFNATEMAQPVAGIPDRAPDVQHCLLAEGTGEKGVLPPASVQIWLTP